MLNAKSRCVGVLSRNNGSFLFLAQCAGDFNEPLQNSVRSCAKISQWGVGGVLLAAISSMSMTLRHHSTHLYCCYCSFFLCSLGQFFSFRLKLPHYQFERSFGSCQVKSSCNLERSHQRNAALCGTLAFLLI